MAKTATSRLYAYLRTALAFKDQAGRAVCALALLTALLLPAIARAELYQWTDASGGMVISDLLPVDMNNIRDLKVLGQTRNRLVLVPPADIQETSRSRERALEARIAELEAQLQDQQYAPPPDMLPPDDTVNAGAPLYPPPPDNGPVVYSSGFRPTPYFVAPPLVSAVVVRSLTPRLRPNPPRPPAIRMPPPARPAPPMVQPAPHYTAGVPQFLGRTPQLVGPTPRFIPSRPRSATPPHFEHRPATPNRMAAAPRHQHERRTR